MKTLPVSLVTAVCAASLALTSAARAADERPEPAEAPPPKAEAAHVGGHLGVATPYVAVSKQTHVIGSEQFLTILNPIGVTVHTSDAWALDFEIVVATSVLKKEPTGLIIDPGVIYKALPVALGLRVAYQVGEAGNVGAIPLVNKGFNLGTVTWFIEAAFPTFVKQGEVTFNAVAHTGVAF